MDNSRKQILILYWYPVIHKELRTAIRQHLHVLDHSECHQRLLYYNAFYGVPSWLRRCRFDAVLLHTTFLCVRWSSLFYSWKWKLKWIADLDCVKIALPQDEYDHSEILDEWMFEWGISVIFTNFDESKRKILYPLMHNRATFYECLTGYIHDFAVADPPAIDSQDRPYDIVYRATHLPYWFGRHGQLKHHIADVVARRASAHGLTCDISTHEKDTIVGERWMKFLASGRTVIGCESGSSVLDRRGEIRARIRALQGANPSMSFHETDDHMPSGWDDHSFFALSPRHLEAIITKTCQVLVEGRYDGVLEPEKHYIPLKEDFSNLDEVMERVRDKDATRAMAERAYDDIYLSGRHTYYRFAADIQRALCKEWRQERKQMFNQLLWLCAHLRSRLAIQTLKAHIRYERFKQAISHG